MNQKPSKPRRYSEDFKREAIDLAEKIGISKASKELGISYATLKSWISRQMPKGSDKNAPTYEELLKENRRLSKEMEYLEKINSVLKKSTAIFSKSEMGDFW